MPRADLFIVLAHALVLTALGVSLATGLGLALDSGASPAAAPAQALAGVLPEGRLVRGHIVAGLGLTGVAAAHVLWRIRRGGRLLAPGFWLGRWRATAGTADHPAIRRQVWDVAVLHAGFVLLGLLAVTGALLYRPLIAPGTVAVVHGGLAMLVPAWLVAHMVAVTLRGRLTALFRPRAVALGATGLALAGGAVIAGGVIALDRISRPVLRVAPAAPPPVLDGRANDPAWAAAEPVTVHTHRGDHLDGGATPVTLRAVRDDRHIHFLVQWPDATASRIHLPLERTARGWRLVEDGFEADDERTWYEDKLALLFGRTPALGSGTAHFGAAPVAGPHRPVTRGQHYTTDGTILDLWHWKALRTGAQQPGRADDNVIGAPLPSVHPGARHTAGYRPDRPGSGGYRLNFCLRDDPDCTGALARIRRTGVWEPIPGSADRRRRRCRDLGAACEPLLMPIVLPQAPDRVGAGVVRAVPDRVADPTRLADLPVGTRVPGVLIDGRASENRAHVRAAGHWADGIWTLELTRSLATGAPDDLPFRADEPLFLWVAPFDGTQTRHGRHLEPIEIRLTEDSPTTH